MALKRTEILGLGIIMAVILIVPSLGFGETKKKVIRLETITVEGRIQKPQAFYILQRSNLNFEGLEKTESFISNVIKSVEKEPF